MDTLSHILWAGLLLQKPGMAVPIAIASNLPDMVGNSPYWFYVSKDQIRSIFRDKIHHRKRPTIVCSIPMPYPYHERAFHLTHNFFAWALFTWILTAFFPQYRILSLAYLSHVVLDIPAHVGRWSIRPFYPFSNFAIEGKYWWQKNVVAVNIILLIILSLVIKIY